MQNRVESAKALVDIACEKSHTGNWIFDEFEIEDVFGFSPTEEDIENIAKKAYEDGRVADVLYYPVKDHMGATTWYLDILIYTDYCDNLEDDYSQNMPCDNYGMGACSPSCPKFWECN